jgi:hypothetical protein
MVIQMVGCGGLTKLFNLDIKFIALSDQHIHGKKVTMIAVI